MYEKCPPHLNVVLNVTFHTLRTYCNRLRCVSMFAVWFSVGDVEFVETVEIWRVWTFGTLINEN